MRCGGGGDGGLHRAIIRGGLAATADGAHGDAAAQCADRAIPPTMNSLRLVPGQLALADLRNLWAEPMAVAVDPSAKAVVDAAARTVERVIASGRTVYGVNTGFGLLARTRIDDARLAELQRALVLSHSAGTGALLDDAVVRLVIALKAASLARGHSGVRWSVIEALVALANAGIVPCIPAQGSVGASGDLAPLAHLRCRADRRRRGARRRPRHAGARGARARAACAPVTLAPKEGLALLNGTQVSTALALAGLFAAERAHRRRVRRRRADGRRVPRQRHAVRCAHPGGARPSRAGGRRRDLPRAARRQRDPRVAQGLPARAGSVQPALPAAGDGRVPRPDAARGRRCCSPKPTRSPTIRWCSRTTGEMLSGGNFHAEPVAFAADNLALAIAEIGALSERRIALLMDTNLSGLPPFLVEDGGVNSGFMIAQVTAAALASENKSLAHPASVDSLPTSANQEDHVSMATFAARRLAPMAANTARIVAIELLAAAQGVDLRKPLATSPPLAAAHRDDPRRRRVLGPRSRVRARPRGDPRCASSAATSSRSLRSSSHSPSAGDPPCTATIRPNSPPERRHALRRPRDSRAARHRAHREELAHRGAAADAHEQPRSRGRRESEGARRLRRHRPRRAQLGVLRRDRRRAARARATTSRC